MINSLFTSPAAYDLPSERDPRFELCGHEPHVLRCERRGQVIHPLPILILVTSKRLKS